MTILLKTVAVILILGFLGLVGWSYLPGSLTPSQAQVTQPVTLNVD
ncbi:hypothetical protein [Haematobacter massiliensis]|nr:hypothetical protein [Haematobacter massiliensis]